MYSGTVTAAIKNLAPNSYDIWLVGSQKADKHIQVTQRLGHLIDSGNNTYRLESQLNRSEMQDIYLSRIIVSSDLQNPLSNILLSGSPSLFQKIFYGDQYWTAAQLESALLPNEATDQSDSIFDQLLPKAAYAKSPRHSLDDTLSAQIAKGRDIFINETFEGNGRTCSTCHRLDNNHTIDAKYIAQLADDDPLFIAETNPDLANLEQPKLLRQFGLVLTNIDGFDKPGVLRSVPHLLALGTSITPEDEFEAKHVIHALGWSADGAPDDGSLRTFTIGAVMQHMPKTLNREAGIDFRLPTNEELDALEAYMLSLGRSEDLDLDNMYFSSPLVQRGRELFHSKEPGTGQCKGCHVNAGANSSSSLQNGNRNTGVENMPDNLLKLVWKQTPTDGGFGRDQRSDCGWSEQYNCFGNHEFNMTTVVEAADTPPFFHNNSVNTIEEAVAFYNSNAFHASPGANPADPDDPDSVCERCIHLEPTQVTAIALFLRTINAMENIRSANDLLHQAKFLKRHQRNELILLAIAETEDAIEVLEGGAIIPNPESVKLLHKALSLEQRALQKRNRRSVGNFINEAIEYQQLANDLILTEAPENSDLLASTSE
ncbi:hypothetical protein [Methyloprofundus sp.]|uniref:hypothetical protein n=1 Tax=Methyloprofundus sp. TaxID=2020875 RepID=UPI003D14F744